MRHHWLYIFCFVATLPAPLHAQLSDGQVLRPGEVGISAAAEDHRLDRRFSDGGTEPLASDYDGPLTVDRFAFLEPVADRLDAFLQATSDVEGAQPVDPFAITAGGLAADASWSTRYLPIRLSAGILPGLEIGIRVPLIRNERLPRSLDLTGPNVGVNPDPAGNAALLGDLAPELGGGPLLPLADSPLGLELQRRVEARTGEQLMLPETELHGAELLALFPTIPLNRAVSEWVPGDLEIDARFRLLSSFGDRAHPAAGSEGLAHRLTLQGAARLATGQRSTLWSGLDRGPVVGASGMRAGAIGDLFWGDRWWMTLSGQGEWLNADQTEFAISDGLLAPGAPATITAPVHDTIELRATPRVRLTREVALGGTMRWERLTGDDADGSRTWYGLGLEYSTLPAWEEGRSSLPLEAALGYTAAASGSAGVTAPAIAYVRISLRYGLWGSARR